MRTSSAQPLGIRARLRPLQKSNRHMSGTPMAPHRALLTVLAAVVVLTPLPTLAADDFAGGRRIFLEKADCAYCHGWAGDGAGQGQSPGAAANLRRSQLNRDSLIMVISCEIGRAHV